MSNITYNKESGLLRVAHSLSEQIGNFAKINQLTFSEDDKQRVLNSLRTIEPMLISKGRDWTYFNSPELRNNIINVLQQVAFLGLNPSATPRECFFIWRSTKVNDKYVDFVEFGIEGMGNDTILRNFGVNVYQVKSYIVYEGDEFSGVIYDGFEEKLPTFKPKIRKIGEAKGKAMYAVYLIMKNDGRVETAIAEREDVKQSLLAHIRQNGRSYKEIEDVITYLDQYTLDNILDLKVEKQEYVLTNTWSKSGGKEKVKLEDLISPAWRSVISREKMIERKIRNHAIRRYPKDFGSKVITEKYEQTFEEENYAKKEHISEAEIIENKELDFVEEANKNTIPNIEIKQEDETQGNNGVDNTDILVGDTIVVDSEPIEEEKPKDIVEEMPDWMK